MINDRDLYTEIAPADLWRVYASTEGIFRGGGSDTSPKLASANGPRARDFTLVYDPVERAEVAVPSGATGLSFSSSVERLQRLPIPGRVWVLPRGAELPEGLTFVYRTSDHPLLAVARRMTVVELMIKLAAVAALMRPTDTRIR